jgi:hypothetical protein
MIIPVQALPNQKFNVDLDGQNCEIEILMRGLSLYMNLSIDDKVIQNGMICLNNVDIIQYNHLPFKGRMFFQDTQGNLDPLYYGLGDRWILNYVQQ